MSWIVRGQTTQSLYVLKVRATIIGYVPLLVVYGIFEPLLGKAYLLHLGVHLSFPWVACILAIDFLTEYSLCVLVGFWDHGYLSMFMFS